MKNVIVRSLTGIVYIGAIVGSIFAGLNWFAILLAVLMIPSVYELSRMSGKASHNRMTLMLDLIAGELMLLLGMTDDTQVTFIAPMLAVIMLVRFVAQLYLPALKPVESLAGSALSWIYIALPLSMLGWLYTISPAIVLGMFIMIWLNDTGAFCVGSLVGRHKLFERISPKKSWEGFVGGLLFSTGAGALYHYAFGAYFTVDGIALPLGSLMVMGVLTGVAGTLGDLCESSLKRACGVKDSGNILPGHGGMLDRIDSLLMVAPAVAAYLMMFHL